MGERERQNSDEHTRIYIMVDDIRTTLKKIRGSGGRVLTPRRDIAPGAGAFAVFADPAGTEFGHTRSRSASRRPQVQQRCGLCSVPSEELTMRVRLSIFVPECLLTKTRCHLTGPAYVFQDFSSLQPARQVNAVVRLQSDSNAGK